MAVTARVDTQPGLWRGLRLISPPATIRLHFSGPVHRGEVERRVTTGLGPALSALRWEAESLVIGLEGEPTDETERVINLEGVPDATGLPLGPHGGGRFRFAPLLRYQRHDLGSGEVGETVTLPLPLSPAATSTDGRWLVATFADGRQRYPYLVYLPTGMVKLLGADDQVQLRFEGTWLPGVGNNGAVLWEADGRWFHAQAASGADGSVAVSVFSPDSTLCGAALSPAGDRVALVTRDGTGETVDLTVLALPGQEVITRYPQVAATVKVGDEPCVSAPAWTHDASQLLLLDREGQTVVNRLFDLAAGRFVRTLPLQRRQSGGALSPDRRYLVTPEGLLRLGDRLLAPLNSSTLTVLWSPGGDQAVIVDTTGAWATLVDLERGELRRLANGYVLGWASAGTVWWVPGRK